MLHKSFIENIVLYDQGQSEYKMFITTTISQLYFTELGVTQVCQSIRILRKV